ncbi:MAG TPA: phosphoadenylyl-sulfate reductase [Solirubrobacteraceae bacterium]|jgi:phosphoadenosine phosphosulfate reductase|nr:phosphoadenylyl-sulfate reductase [Solirubrobacteraceae bacterium]
MTAIARDLDHAPAQEVLAYAVERFGSKLTMACSFQKEESVLVHMLAELTDEPRVFTIDTGVLFAQTLSTWKAFEERFAGLRVDVVDATSPGEPWTLERCCGTAKVDALERALGGDVEAWVTGIRREQATTRAEANKFERDEKRGIWKVNPLADWTEKDVWRYIFDHDLPYNPLHDEGYASIGCAPCTRAGSGRDGRWAGSDKTECGIHE